MSGNHRKSFVTACLLCSILLFAGSRESPGASADLSRMKRGSHIPLLPVDVGLVVTGRAKERTVKLALGCLGCCFSGYFSVLLWPLGVNILGRRNFDPC